MTVRGDIPRHPALVVANHVSYLDPIAILPKFAAAPLAKGEVMSWPVIEMGSRSWIRKNPLRGLTAAGRFNPIKPHRVRRTLRRNLPLLDCLFHAAASRRWI